MFHGFLTSPLLCELLIALCGFSVFRYAHRIRYPPHPRLPLHFGFHHGPQTIQMSSILGVCSACSHRNSNQPLSANSKSLLA
ncbi:hypothetical protein PILCRDRAFT_650234 [Piloderma croceum F 1598]|uniref:Uncharacterized protein n=1 Tax=Piloderma croceum (strain F 1598) TaxID=765440 RepID=A0A0C3BFZ7_PILCF|nr:hypothetical protein PILCRDRAFT_650234 [Piloderma croceum F 1598]